MNKTNTKNKKKDFAPSFGLWPTKKGTGFTAVVTKELIDTLSKAEEGGRLFMQEVPEEAREENEKLPTYRVAIFPPSDNENSSL